MLRLKPLTEEKAPEDTKIIYSAIRQLLHAPSVPLFFQYIGNFPQYLEYVWSVVAPNIDTPGFTKSCEQIVHIADSAISVIYTPSSTASVFAQQLQPEEKMQIGKTIVELRSLNVQMMLLTIAIRESLKGIYISSQQITESAYTRPSHIEQSEKTLDEIVRESLLNVSSNTQAVDTKVAHMLVPVYGGDSLMISQYPAFFSMSEEELEKLMQTEAYLKARVEMEKITHILLLQLPSPIHLSYRQTAEMLFDKPNASDLLFVMKDTFPALFPKLVLATEMMEKMVQI